MTKYKNKADELYKKKVIELDEVEQAQTAKNPYPSEDFTTAEKPEDDFLVYGSDRTRRQKTMLSLFMLGDKAFHLPYTQIMLVQTLENRLISIYVHFGIIEITGVNTDLIALCLKHGSLSYIREGGKENPPKTPDGVCVYTITHKLTGISED